MFARLGFAAFIALVLGVAIAATDGASAQTPEKVATLTPSSGPVGTVVTA